MIIKNNAKQIFFTHNTSLLSKSLLFILTTITSAAILQIEKIIADNTINATTTGKSLSLIAWKIFINIKAINVMHKNIMNFDITFSTMKFLIANTSS